MSNILVIDDEKGFLHVLHQLLTGLGYDVETAGDGLEGIRKFDNGSFSIVITDLRMPVIDGTGVLEHIRKSNKRSVPVIAISGTPWLVGTSDFDKVLAGLRVSFNRLQPQIGCQDRGVASRFASKFFIDQAGYCFFILV